nr:immunoglobulin light chain junction region [Macaca mulatta]MOY06384.1 immunoglobulin light chain junction region [Macaca mulatta]
DYHCQSYDSRLTAQLF